MNIFSGIQMIFFWLLVIYTIGYILILVHILLVFTLYVLNQPVTIHIELIETLLFESLITLDTHRKTVRQGKQYQQKRWPCYALVTFLFLDSFTMCFLGDSCDTIQQWYIQAEAIFWTLIICVFKWILIFYAVLLIYLC